MSPRLSFFCELDSWDLSALFEDGSVVEQLVALSATVAMGLRDLSPERAAVVSRLSAAGIPVIAWLLLPMDQGYWFNANNAAFASARYDAFRAWTAQHNLTWDAVGMDVEPDTREIQRALKNRWSLVPTVARRVVDDRARSRATRQYHDLVARAHADGYRVQSYEILFMIPLLEDEALVGASVIRRVMGVVDVGADVEIPMLYTSFMGARGAGLLWSYGRGKEAILIGSTGGGVSVGDADQVPPLDWTAFERDLLLASRLASEVGIFSLEGCVRQGFLARLPEFDWSGPVEIPTAQAATIDRWRAAARVVLWVTARPYLLVGLLGFVVALRRINTRASTDAEVVGEK